MGTLNIALLQIAPGASLEENREKGDPILPYPMASATPAGCK